MAAQIASHISSGARRRSTSGAPSSRGSSASSHEGPAIGVLPTRRGRPPRGDGDQPGRGDPQPGIRR